MASLPLFVVNMARKEKRQWKSRLLKELPNLMHNVGINSAGVGELCMGYTGACGPSKE